MRRYAPHLVLLLLAASCWNDRAVETVPPSLLVDETLPEDERKAAEEKRKAEAEAEAPAIPEVTTPDNVDAPPDDAKKTSKGVYYVVLRPGTGNKPPRESSKVRVHYSGWTTDGELFDSSVRRGEPAEFPVNALIPGWVEILQLMVVGEKRRIWIPEDLAYKGRAGAPQGMLVFDMELLAIVNY